MAIGDFVYQAQAPGGVINQIIVTEPIRPLARPVDVRPRVRDHHIERSGVLAEVTEAADHGPAQIVADDGWGKTSVVAQLARHRRIEQYRDGIAVVSGWGLPVEDVEQAIFDVFFQSTLPDTVHKITPGQLRTSLGDVEAAILVDDLDIPRQHVDRLIDACGHSVFVSTASTQTMWSDGLVVGLDGMDNSDALTLFEHRLGGSIDPGDLEAVTAFVAKVRGFPMAIVAAASAARRGADLVAMLPRLVDAPNPIGVIQGEIAKTFTLAETRLLSALAAVRGNPLPPEAVGRAAGVDNAGDLLEGLKRDGIVEAASPRYRLPSTSAALMNLPIDAPATAQGLTQWCVAETDTDLISAAAPAIVSAIGSAVQAGDHRAAIALGRSADGAVSLSGRWGVWGQLLDATREAAVASTDPFAEGWSLHQLGTRALAEQRHDEALSKLTEAADIRRRIGDTAGLDVTEHNLSLLSPPPAAVPPHHRASAPSSSSGIPWWAWTMILVGLLAAVVTGILVYGSINDSPDPQTPPVVTTIAAKGSLTSTPEFIEFSELPPGESASAEVSLFNTGPGSVNIENIEIEGHEAYSFTTDCDSLEFAASCRLVVTFQPGELGEARARIRITYTGDNDQLSIPIIGAAIEPPAAFLTVDPGTIAFGTVERLVDRSIVTAAGSSEWTRELELRNVGNLDVQVGDIRLRTERFVVNHDCATVVPDTSCFVQVGFVAVETGEFNDTLTIEHSAQNSTFEIAISGFVPTPPNLTIEISEVAEFTPVVVIDPSIDAEALVRIDSFELVDPSLANELQVDLVDSFVEFDSPILVDPLIIADPSALRLDLWTIHVVVEIVNTGQEAIEEDFSIRFETKASDTSGPWITATSADGRPAEFTVEHDLTSVEMVLVTSVLGFSTDVYYLVQDAPQGRPVAQIRVVVDSCSPEDSIVAPPCRIDESDEGDNISQDVEVSFIVVKPVIE